MILYSLYNFADFKMYRTVFWYCAVGDIITNL